MQQCFIWPTEHICLVKFNKGELWHVNLPGKASIIEKQKQKKKQHKRSETAVYQILTIIYVINNVCMLRNQTETLCQYKITDSIEKIWKDKMIKIIKPISKYGLQAYIINV